jgi:hypothetical protein
MPYKNRIRGDLLANREDQPRYRQRLRSEPFGIFRPLTPQSQRELKDALYGVDKTLNRLVPWKEGVKFQVAQHFGVTLVERAQVYDAMKAGSIERSFSFDQMARRLGVTFDLQHGIDDVPVGDLGWYGRNGSKVAVRLDESPELDELTSQSENLEGILQGAQAELGELSPPSHITLCSFGNRKDQETRARVLNNKQRIAAEEIIYERLSLANIGSVCLAPVVIGKGYIGAQHIETLVS